MVNFWLCSTRLWSSLPTECYPLAYDLNTRYDQAKDEKVVSRVEEAEPLQSRKTCKGRQKATWSQCIPSYPDASEAAHGAAVYPVVQYQDGYISSSLVVKIKVAPVTAISITRLELMAAFF